MKVVNLIGTPVKVDFNLHLFVLQVLIFGVKLINLLNQSILLASQIMHSLLKLIDLNVACLVVDIKPRILKLLGRVVPLGPVQQLKQMLLDSR